MLAAGHRRCLGAASAAALLGLALFAAAPSSAGRAASVGVPTQVAAIAAGGFAGYALLRDGRVLAWGDDLEGQIGRHGAWEVSTLPVPVSGLGSVIAIAAGQNTAYALERDGAVRAWGDDVEDELGDGLNRSREVPRPVPVPSGIVAIAAGEFSAYALRRDGTVWAWGDNAWGQLGTGGSELAYARPRPVRRLAHVVAIAAGGSDGYALRADGTVWAWGDGSVGQLGAARCPPTGGGPCPASAVPVEIAGLRDVRAIAAGADTVFALRADGTVWAWGDGTFGALGTRHAGGVARAVRVGGLEHIVASSAGGYTGYALARDGSAWAWGRGVDGELGDGRAANHAKPVRVRGLGRVTDLAGGGVAAYALDRAGRLWAWGSDLYGQLGDGYLLAGLDLPALVLIPGT